MQVVLARVRSLRGEARAERAGLEVPARGTPVPPRPVRALVVFFAAPTAVWMSYCVIVALATGLPLSTTLLFVTLGYGGLISLIAWLLRADTTLSRLPRGLASVGILVGAAITLAFGVIAVTISVPISIGLFLGTAASLALLAPQPWLRRVPVLEEVERSITYRSLLEARTKSGEMQRLWEAARSSRLKRRPSAWTRLIRSLQG